MSRAEEVDKYRDRRSCILPDEQRGEIHAGLISRQVRKRRFQTGRQRGCNDIRAGVGRQDDRRTGLMSIGCEPERRSKRHASRAERAPACEQRARQLIGACSYQHLPESDTFPGWGLARKYHHRAHNRL